MRQTSLFESASFVVAAGGAVALIGGVFLGIGVAQVIPNPAASLWSNPWFWIGLILVVIGGLLVVWSVVLFIAHRHAATHWCPDPAAHELRRNASSEDWRRVRSVLHQIRGDVQGAIDRIDKASTTGRYWGLGAYVLEDRTWNKNRKQLAGVAGMTQLLDALTAAYEYVHRIKGFVFLRALQGGRVRPGDDLDSALAALRAAREQLDSSVAALAREQTEHPSPQIAPERAITTASYHEYHLENAASVTFNLPGIAPVSASSNTAFRVDDQVGILVPASIFPQQARAAFGAWPPDAVDVSFDSGTAFVPPELQRKTVRPAAPRHGLHFVGGTISTCRCGFHADSGSEFNAHLRENGAL